MDIRARATMLVVTSLMAWTTMHFPRPRGSKQARFARTHGVCFVVDVSHDFVIASSPGTLYFTFTVGEWSSRRVTGRVVPPQGYVVKTFRRFSLLFVDRYTTRGPRFSRTESIELYISPRKTYHYIQRKGVCSTLVHV